MKDLNIKQRKEYLAEQQGKMTSYDKKFVWTWLAILVVYLLVLHLLGITFEVNY